MATLQWQHTAPLGGRAATSARQRSSRACCSPRSLLGRFSCVMVCRVSRGTSSLACWGERGNTSCRQDCAIGCVAARRAMQQSMHVIQWGGRANGGLCGCSLPCCEAAAAAPLVCGDDSHRFQFRRLPAAPQHRRQPQPTAPAPLATNPNPNSAANMQRLAAATRQLGLQLARGVEAGAPLPPPARPP